jgi:hypothetical protein
MELIADGIINERLLYTCALMEARRNFPRRSCRDFRPIHAASDTLAGVSLERV